MFKCDFLCKARKDNEINKSVATPAAEQHIKNWGTETTDHSTNLDEFCSWFNTASSIEDSIKSGFEDFAYHITKPELSPWLGNPLETTSLEIGYGSGRLMVPACNFFKSCIGVDIHGFSERVSQIIKDQGANNFQLYDTNGMDFPIEDASIDFAYSFIVLQHLPTIEVLKANIGELYRVMKSGAVAILYLGYLQGPFWKSYTDISSNQTTTVREVTLRLKMSFAKKLAKDAGFELVNCQRSTKSPHSTKLGGQFYMVLTKERTP